MFSDLWSKEETPKHSNEKRKFSPLYIQAFRGYKATCFTSEKAIQQDALILRNILRKAYNSGLFALHFKSRSLLFYNKKLIVFYLI